MSKHKTGIDFILEERKRQVEKENWSFEHDQEHECGELAIVASCYAAFASRIKTYKMVDRYVQRIMFVDQWPESWGVQWDKRFAYGSNKNNPGNTLPNPESLTKKERLDLLVKAGALIAAELDRINKVDFSKECKI